MQGTETKGFCAGMSLAVREEMRLTPRVILLVFLVLQIFDGVLTYTAVAWLGVVPALVAAKTLASACGVLLYVRGFYMVLGALTGLYLLAAITPWLMVFHSL